MAPQPKETNTRMSRALVAVLMVIMFVIGAETAYLFGYAGSRTVTSVYTTSNISTVFAPGMTLENFVLCSPNACGTRTASLSGMIILGAGSPTLSSIHLFVNGTDEGIQNCGASSPCQELNPPGIIFYSKLLVPGAQIGAGKGYDVEFVAAFQGNIISTAYAYLTAQ
jgi:hypothetical protein